MQQKYMKLNLYGKVSSNNMKNMQRKHERKLKERVFQKQFICTLNPKNDLHIV